ncbi:MAG: hypothetical protein KIT84_07885 [Labilithrix sp.]|nr:hypothetical protein [Labilithrix sp.]MCW5810917.1 hypothetical protein [Labilithrix sp.]
MSARTHAAAALATIAILTTAATSHAGASDAPPTANAPDTPPPATAPNAPTTPNASADAAADGSADAARAPVVRPPPVNAISVQLLSLVSQGVTLQYERQAARYLSFVTAAGYRWSGGDAFDTTEAVFGVEGRLWILGHAPLTRWSGRAMVGPYVGFRLDGALTRVREGERFVGSMLSTSESVFIGARVVFFERLEITPGVGFGLRQDVDPRGRLATINRPEILRLALSAGVMF